MAGEGRILDLVGRVYDAALDEGLWAGVAGDIARVFNSPSTALILRNDRLAKVEYVSTTDNLNREMRQEYADHYWKTDVWVQRASELGMSKILASQDMIADSAFERTEFWRDWCRRLDQFYIVGAVFEAGAEEMRVLGIHRPRIHGMYHDDDKSLVSQFLPHFGRALQLRRQLIHAGIEKQAALEALDRSGTAAIVLRRDGWILYSNGHGEELLRQGDALRGVNGRLATGNRKATERLSQLVQHAVDAAAGHGDLTPGSPGNSGGGTLSIARPGRLPLTLLAAPFRPAKDGLGTSVPAAILFIRDPETPTPTGAALQGLFGLTPAEAAVAAALTGGKSIDEIATALAVSLNTARTHLKSIYAKTGTNRQAQFTALVLRSAAMLTR